MKRIDRMSRLNVQLEKCFRMMNEEFFGGQLPTCVITVTPSSRSYAHYSTRPVWTVNGEQLQHEVNIASGTLSNRPLEEVLGSLLHEMVHCYNLQVVGQIDCSRGGQYHTKRFRDVAEAVGLIVHKSEKYGYAHTEPGDRLLEWVLEHDELEDILINRDADCPAAPPVAPPVNPIVPIRTATTKKNNSRKYACPCCRTSVRATKVVRIICADCMLPMIEE